MQHLLYTNKLQRPTFLNLNLSSTSLSSSKSCSTSCSSIETSSLNQLNNKQNKLFFDFYEETKNKENNLLSTDLIRKLLISNKKRQLDIELIDQVLNKVDTDNDKFVDFIQFVDLMLALFLRLALFFKYMIKIISIYF